MTPAAVEALRRAAETPETCTLRDLHEVAADLSAAFADYPVFDWILRTDDQRERARDRLFRLMVRDVGFAQGQVERPASGGAAAIWIESERITPNPLWKEIRALPTLLAATGPARFARLLQTREALDRNHPMDRPHTYLWMLGVHPDAQGLGVGSRLLSAGLARLDAQRRPAFLETSTEGNVALYRRHGFEVTGEYRLGPGSPPVWPMWREPAS